MEYNVAKQKYCDYYTDASICKIDYQENLNTIKTEMDTIFNNEINNLSQMCNFYSTTINNLQNTYDYYLSLEVKNNILKDQVVDGNTLLITNDRKNYYGDQEISNLTFWNTIYTVIYYILFVILIIILFFNKQFTWKYKLFIILGFSIITIYIFNKIISYLYNKLKNVNIDKSHITASNSSLTNNINQLNQVNKDLLNYDYNTK
jgi:hypothetical protein